MVYCKNKRLTSRISISFLMMSSWAMASDTLRERTDLETLHPTPSLSTEIKAASVTPEAIALFNSYKEKISALSETYRLNADKLPDNFLELEAKTTDLLRKSAEADYDTAQYLWGVEILNKVNNILGSDQFTPEQKSARSFQKLIDEKRNKGLEWLIKAAKQGNSELQYSLGERYDRGLLIRPDIKQAQQWYKYAADQDHSTAQLRLARLYENQQTSPETYLKLYAALAKKQDISPYFNLGMKYFNLISFSDDSEKEKDFYEQALKWFPEIADQEIYEARYELVYRAQKTGDPKFERVLILLAGHPLEKNSVHYAKRRDTICKANQLLAMIYHEQKKYSDPFLWLERGAAFDNPPAIHNLGHYFEKGYVGQPNFDKAQQYFARAQQIENQNLEKSSNGTEQTLEASPHQPNFENQKALN